MTTETRNENRKSKREQKAPDFIAFHVTERDKKSFWTRIGAAWDHEDAKGMTLHLDIIPASNGRIVLREPLPKDGEETAEGRS